MKLVVMCCYILIGFNIYLIGMVSVWTAVIFLHYMTVSWSFIGWVLLEPNVHYGDVLYFLSMATVIYVIV